MEALDSSEQPVGSPSPTSGERGRIITSVRKVTQWILMRGTLGTAEERYTTGKKMELRKSRIQRCPTKIQGEPQVWATCVILNFIAAIFYNIIIQYVIDIKIVNDIYYLFILSLWNLVCTALVELSIYRAYGQHISVWTSYVSSAQKLHVTRGDHTG